MVTSMTSDLLVRSWDMQLTASVGNLHIADHYITGKQDSACQLCVILCMQRVRWRAWNFPLYSTNGEPEIPYFQLFQGTCTYLYIRHAYTCMLYMRIQALRQKAKQHITTCLIMRKSFFSEKISCLSWNRHEFVYAYTLYTVCVYACTYV